MHLEHVEASGNTETSSDTEVEGNCIGDTCRAKIRRKRKNLYNKTKEDKESSFLICDKATDKADNELGDGEGTSETSLPDSSELQKRIRLMGQSREPWPKDVKLFQPYEVEQILLPDNANCLAVQAFLKMCNLDFQVEHRHNAEFMSPTGRVPFIKAGAFVIPELEGIVQHAGSKGINLTHDLDNDQKSDMRAYMSLIHNVLENAELYICWCDNETYTEVTKPRNGSVYPWPLNHIQNWTKRRDVIKRLKLLGWYEKKLSEVYQEVENCCQALTDRLDGKEYFFGNNFCELDALIYGHIRAILTTPVPAQNNAFGFAVAKFKSLINYVKKIDQYVMGCNTDFSVYPYRAKIAKAVDVRKIEIPIKAKIYMEAGDAEQTNDDEESWERISEEEEEDCDELFDLDVN